MIPPKNYKKLSCVECMNGIGLDFEITMAFQPIVNINTRSIFAHEALVRGINNESASEIFKKVNEENRYCFDQACRVKAIQVASELGLDTFLSINFMPRAVYRPEVCIRTTLEAAERFGFPTDRIIFEVTEGEKLDDQAHLVNILQSYKAMGFKTAIDDFGAGHSGLNLLAELPTDIIKLDIALIREIDKNRTRQAIVKGIIQVCHELSIEVLGEGVETYEEMATLKDFGIELFQGYYFAKPAFRALATVPSELYDTH